jgi:hypothetical protein
MSRSCERRGSGFAQELGRAGLDAVRADSMVRMSPPGFALDTRLREADRGVEFGEPARLIVEGRADGAIGFETT